MPLINWTDPNAMISLYFTVSQCLFLPTWHRIANEHDGLNNNIKYNISKICHKLDVIQTLLNSPVKIHSFYRPPDYSPLVGGFIDDVHTTGEACDFSVPGMTMDHIKEVLVPLLEGLEMRMEYGTNTHIHMDIHPPGPRGRYFRPFLTESI